MLSQRRIEILERHLASRKEVPENVPEYLYTLTGDRPGKLVFLGKWKYLLGPKSHYACGSLTLACMPSLVFIKAIDLTDTNNILTRLIAPISNFINSKGSKESNSIHCLINFLLYWDDFVWSQAKVIFSSAGNEMSNWVSLEGFILL